MNFNDLRPLSITLYLSSIIFIPASLFMGMLGILGLTLEIPIVIVSLVFAGVYLYQSVKSKRFHFLILYPLVLLILFAVGFMYDLGMSHETIASLQKYGNIVETYYSEHKEFPKSEQFKSLGLDLNCRIIETNQGSFVLEYRDGIFSSYDRQISLRPRP